MEVLHKGTSEGNTQCLSHPFKNISPGGICAFCLQEKLGKLVSSSSSPFPSTVFPSLSASSSSSPSFRSDNLSTNAIKSSAKHPTRRSRFPFVLADKTSNNHTATVDGLMNFPTSDAFNRSKSTTSASNMRLLGDEDKTPYYSPRRRGFWPFLHSRKSADKRHNKDSNFAPTIKAASPINSREKQIDELVVVAYDEDDDRKVSRSRSIGCGSSSRRFSNDILERISNGFGDCGATLRRVESHREGKNSCVGMIGGHDFIKERVSCGGIFSGFVHVVVSSSSSSSASHGGRSMSWGRALASPMRAFAKKRSSSDNAKNNGAPNLAGIPSILGS